MSIDFKYLILQYDGFLSIADTRTNSHCLSRTDGEEEKKPAEAGYLITILLI